MLQGKAADNILNNIADNSDDDDDDDNDISQNDSENSEADLQKRSGKLRLIEDNLEA